MKIINKITLIFAIFLFSFTFLTGCQNKIYEDDAVYEFYRELANYEDIDDLVIAMSEADIVLLGESTHGTQEYYKIRSILSKRLIDEHDFNFIAVEGDWNSIYDLNLYVKGLSDKNSALEVLKEFDRWPTWMWANDEIKKLAEWLKEYNKKLPLEDMVGIYGFDVYGTESSILAVQELTGENYECLSSFTDDFSLYAHYLSLGNDPCYSEAQKIYNMIKSEDRFKEVLDEKEYFYLKQNAFVVKKAEIHYRAMVYPEISSWNERVLHMNSTLDRLIQKKGKAIIWAHNTHVGDARATEMAYSGSINIGQLMREANKNIFILGFGTYTGQVLAGRSWGESGKIMNIPEAREESYEYLFESIGMEKALIMLDSLELPDEIKKVNNNRAIGVVYRPENEYPGNYVKTDLSKRYDAFIFIRNTTSIKLLE